MYKEDTTKKVKRQTTEWEQIPANHVSDPSLVSRISTELFQLKKRQTTQADISPDKMVVADSRRAQEMMLNILSQQGMKNHHHDGEKEEVRQQQVLARMWKRLWDRKGAVAMVTDSWTVKPRVVCSTPRCLYRRNGNVCPHDLLWDYP